MKPFEHLTNRGKVRRLRQLAFKALEQYEFKVSDIQLVKTAVNTLFRVRTTDGPSYIIRICGVSWRTTADLLSEMIWLQALSRETDIGVPEPQCSRNGHFIVWAEAEGIPGAYPCVVTSWIPGTLLGTRLTETNLYKMGILLARLHQQAAGFSPPETFTRRRMDKIYACGEQDVLFDDCYRDVFTPRTREIFEQTRDKIDEAFECLYREPAGLRVIHNDLHHNNINIYQGHLYPLDFEFMMWGYPVQDLAVARYGLMDTVEPDAFEALQSAFRAGYESRLKWSETYEGQIDAFQAARRLWVANYLAQFERASLQEFVDWLVPQFDHFLTIGTIKRF